MIEINVQISRREEVGGREGETAVDSEDIIFIRDKIFVENLHTFYILSMCILSYS